MTGAQDPLDVVARAINEAIERGDRDQQKADNWYQTAGLRMLEAQRRLPVEHPGMTWLDWHADNIRHSMSTTQRCIAQAMADGRVEDVTPDEQAALAAKIEQKLAKQAVRNANRKRKATPVVTETENTAILTTDCGIVHGRNKLTVVVPPPVGEFEAWWREASAADRMKVRSIVGVGGGGLSPELTAERDAFVAASGDNRDLTFLGFSRLHWTYAGSEPGTLTFGYLLDESFPHAALVGIIGLAGTVAAWREQITVEAMEDDREDAIKTEWGTGDLIAQWKSDHVDVVQEREAELVRVAAREAARKAERKARAPTTKPNQATAARIAEHAMAATGGAA